jgi:thiol-disulfide isomerase/thioredoxin
MQQRQQTESHRSKWYWLRWVALASAVTIVCLGYFAAPKLIRFWQMLQRNKVATEIASTLIGQQPADWHTTDIDGGPHALTDYRGKIVVLDFWYSGCGWCVEAIPQINDLAREFKDEPVAILGVNSDQEAGDAQRILEMMSVSYPTLKEQHEGEHLCAMYKVTLWPTIFVLDQRGIARHVVVGYWPSLQSEVGSKIRGLLDEHRKTGGKQ